jgi:hypothetical protein
MAKDIMLVCPVYRRFTLTRLMLEHRVKTFNAAAHQYGVDCQCVCIGDPQNLQVAEALGFDALEAPYVLGRKYSDGHSHAYNQGWRISFQVNSDQVFTPELLAAIAQSPDDQLIETSWLTAVHGSGRKAISYKNYAWAMKACPTSLLANNPRPCDDTIMSMCDTSTHLGVIGSNPPLKIHEVETGPLETIQFESGFQVTPWSRNVKVGAMGGYKEGEVPWFDIANIHGDVFTMKMRDFYGLD